MSGSAMNDSAHARTMRGGKRAIGILAFAQSIDFTEPQILNSMYPAVQASLNLADSALGYLTAVKRGVEIFSVFFWGLMSDRFRRKEVLAASTLLGGIASILTGFAPEFAFFFFVTMLINLGTAAMEGQTNSVLSDFYPVKERGKAFGILRGLAYSGLIFSLILFSILADSVPTIGWRIAYWGFGAVAIIASITIWHLLDEPTRGQTEQALANVSLDVIQQKESRAFSVREALANFRTPTIIVDSINLILLGFPKIMLVNYSVTFFVKVRDIREGQAILITLLGLIGFIVGSMSGGVVGDRISRFGYPVTDFDFSVPGVTSLSVDLHKYGYAAKGASVILYRNRELRRPQIFVSTDWAGGIYAAPTMTGTRPGGAIAAAWAVMNYLGEEGYTAIADVVMKTATKVRDGINAIDGIQVLGKPEMSVMAIASERLNVYEIGDEMTLQGWHLDRQQFPPTLHVTINYAHAQSADAFLRDLAESVAIVKKPGVGKIGNAFIVNAARLATRVLPESIVSKLTARTSSLFGGGSGLPERSAAMYGMMGTLPNRGDLKELVLDLVEGFTTQTPTR